MNASMCLEDSMDADISQDNAMYAGMCQGDGCMPAVYVRSMVSVLYVSGGG